MAFRFFKKWFGRKRTSHPAKAGDVLGASAEFFDDAKDIMQSCGVDVEGRIGNPELFAEKMMVRAKELASKKPTSAVLAWLESNKVGGSLTPADMMIGAFESHSGAEGPEEMTTAFHGWVRRRVLQDEAFVACGLDPDAVDWEVVAAPLIQTLMSHMPR